MDCYYTLNIVYIIVDYRSIQSMGKILKVKVLAIYFFLRNEDTFLNMVGVGCSEFKSLSQLNTCAKPNMPYEELLYSKSVEHITVFRSNWTLKMVTGDTGDRIIEGNIG